MLALIWIKRFKRRYRGSQDGGADNLAARYPRQAATKALSTVFSPGPLFMVARVIPTVSNCEGGSNDQGDGWAIG
jgi:hypothetical protein